MREKRFQHRAATGSMTLPVAALFTALVCVAPGPADPLRWSVVACVALVTYVMVELNNAHSLIRIRSRLMSSVYLMLTASCVFLHVPTAEWLAPLCVALAYYGFFHTYQHARPEHPVFFAFACVGTGAQFFPPLLYFVPFYYASLLFQLHALGLRTFFAGLLGLAFPFWVRGGTDYCLGRPDALLPLLTQLTRFETPCYTAIDAHRWAALGLMTVAFAVGSLHFLRTYYADKLRIRMFYYVLLCQGIIALAALALLPRCFDTLLRLFTVTASPVIAHYFALTDSRATNTFFLILLFLICYLILGSLWTALWIF